MKYWLCILTPENYKIVKEKLIWGVEERHKKYLDQVSKGDKFVMYVTKESKIKGVFEAESDPFKDETPIFEGGIYPYRVKIRPLKLNDEGVSIKELLSAISIFQGKKNWTGVIQGKAMREITENDFNLILDKL